MRESDFIKNKHSHWQEFERLRKNRDNDPERLSELFVRITNDLSYARTYYRNRAVRVYLNMLSQSIFSRLYRSNVFSFKSLKDYWQFSIPSFVYHTRKEMLISFIVFSLAILIGVLSSVNDGEFARFILGDRYVEMTLANIESGDPMKVYKDSGATEMFLGITLNNLRVALLTFVMGVFASIGTVGILISNGVMLGTFQYFFYEHGLLGESALTIWQHGTLEISAIIIAGGAGLTLGRGLLFPGNYSRLHAFRISAKRGFNLMLSIAPIIIIAGFIEGFITRFTELPFILRLIVIILSLAFILFYYVFYPFYLSRIGRLNAEKIEYLRGSDPQKIELHAIRDAGALFISSLAIMRFSFIKLLRFSIVLSVLGSVFIVSLKHAGYLELNLGSFSFNSLGSIFNIANEPLYYAAFLAILITAILSHSYILIEQYFLIKSTNSQSSYFLKTIAINFLISLLCLVPFYAFGIGTGLFIFLLFFPLFLFASVFINKSIAGAELISYFFGNGFAMMTFYLSYLFVSFIVLFMLNGGLFFFYFEIISWGFPLSPIQMNLLFNGVFLFIVFLSLSIILPFFIMGSYLHFYSIKEVKSAGVLKDRISKFLNQYS